ncbi:acyl carrier protein [Streptomyces lasalocidi]
MGVDSATTLVLAADLTALLRREIRPAEIFEHPSIEKLAAHLTSPVTQEAAA